MLSPLENKKDPMQACSLLPWVELEGPVGLWLVPSIPERGFYSAPLRNKKETKGPQPVLPQEWVKE